MAKISASFLAVAGNSLFNNSEWKPFGEAYKLKDIWEAQFPDQPNLYDDIQGDEAEVVAVEFASGDTALRLEIPFKDGTSVQLKLAKGDYDEGDKVKISTITGQELHKVGADPIIRYSGEVI